MSVRSQPLTALQGRQARLWKRVRNSAKWYPLILINLVVYVVFNVIPWIQMFTLSFQRWDMLSPKKYVGLGNFASLTRDPILVKALSVTGRYLLMYVPPLLFLSLFVAILVNQPRVGMKPFRAAYFLPNVTSVTVLSIIFWKFLSPRADGPLNYLIGLLGIPRQTWLVSVKLALPSVVGLKLWQSFGYYMVLWLAGLQGVPAELYDAGLVDGASGWKLHWYVTIPLLRPTAAFIILISTIGAIQVFGSIYILTAGGPFYATMTIVYYIYNQAFTFAKLGYACSVSVLLFAIIFVITYFQGKFLRFGEHIY